MNRRNFLALPLAAPLAALLPPHEHKFDLVTKACSCGLTKQAVMGQLRFEIKDGRVDEYIFSGERWLILSSFPLIGKTIDSRFWMQTPVNLDDYVK